MNSLNGALTLTYNVTARLRPAVESVMVNAKLARADVDAVPDTVLESV